MATDNQRTTINQTAANMLQHFKLQRSVKIRKCHVATEHNVEWARVEPVTDILSNKGYLAAQARFQAVRIPLLRKSGHPPCVR